MSGNKELVSQFDLSREVSSLYFKSSFARSMFSNSNQSKSLDYVYFDNTTIDEENENETKTPTDDMNFGGNNILTSPLKLRYSNNLFDQQYQNDNFRSNIGGNNQNKTSNAITFRKSKQLDGETPKVSHGDEVTTLRKECQRLAAENQRLQQTMAGPGPHLHLQTQVDTLQWQLKQAESSRQMYRAVLEQVSKFLERVHKNLDQVNGKPPPAKCKARVPRSRSVHTVATSRPASPSPSVSPSHTLRYNPSFHRANSVTQIQDSHSHTLSYSMSRDSSWRSSKSVTDELPPEKLSQEAFRLLRTVQSLLGTQEPDLTHRLTPAPTPTPALSDSSHDTTWSVGSCSSLLPHVCSSGSQRKSLEALSCSVEGEGEGEGGAGDASTPQLSVGSAEDESGFSSMSSFHEVGLPECRAYPEVGLPLVEPNHRRWSSTPIDSRPSHAIQVLWV